MEKLEKIIIDKEQINHMVKALFDNGKRSLFYINGKIMTQIYLEFIADTDMIEIFQDVYDLEKLIEETSRVPLRYFPDKILDVLDMTMSYAEITNNKFSLDYAKKYIDSWMMNAITENKIIEDKMIVS